jgi:hypothetical protein
MNWFDGLKDHSLFQIVVDDTTEPIRFVYEVGDGRPDLRVQFMNFSRLSIQDARTEAALTFDLAALASPGRAVRVGTRDLHLQFIRADNPVNRGPLLIFEDGDPLPCFLPRHPLALVRRARKTDLLPVFVFVSGDSDEASLIEETKRGLILGSGLVQGLFVPGREDSAYFDDSPPK